MAGLLVDHLSSVILVLRCRPSGLAGVAMPTISIDRPSPGHPPLRQELDVAFHVDEEATVSTRAKPARLQGRKGQP